MGMRKRRDYRWETLLSAVQHKERVRRMTLSEAQQCYDGAMGELTPDEIELLAKIAAERLRGARQLAGWCGGAELVFSADALAGGGGPDTLCEIVAVHPRLLNEECVTDVDSLSVDVRRLQLSRGSKNRGSGAGGVDPVVFDVWTGPEQHGELFGCGERETGGAWEVQAGWGDWGAFECALSAPSWYDFADYGDQGGQGFREN